jgi:hypothetical protein
VSGATVVSACCHVYYALDIGFSVDLRRAVGLIQEARESCPFRGDVRAPAYLNLQPLPVHFTQPMEPIRGQAFATDAELVITIYDFGAVSMDYRIAFQGPLNQLVALSSELYDHPEFASHARARAEALVEVVAPAVKRPKVRYAGEDYLVFAITAWEGAPDTPDGFLRENASSLAQVLSSSTKPLSEQQQREELSRRIAYYADDLTVVTWNAALVFGDSSEEVLTVLELANVQLRELHYLDDQLDGSLEESYDMGARTGNLKTRMRRIRELMLDGQAFSEAVTNAFKPFPDAFLARLYDLTAECLGLNHFNRSIRDKLSLLNTLYSTLSDEADHERSLRLEWIVIALIFIEIILGLSEKLFPLLLHR